MKNFLSLVKTFFTKKNFLATKITAIALAVVIATVSALIIFLDGDSVIKVIRRKKIIRRHENNSSAVDAGADESDGDYDYSDWEALKDYDVNSDDTSTDTSSDEEEETIYEVELDGKGYNDAMGRIGCGFYHYNLGDWEKELGDYYGNEMDFITTAHGSTVESVTKAKENGCTVWFNINNPYANRETLEFIDGFMERYDETIQALKDADLWDNVAGFHFDEPCTKMTGEQFKLLTKYLAETYPHKRIFPVLSTYEVRNQGPQGTIIGEMNYENYAYVTDIGFDWYSVKGVKISQYRDLVNLMMENLGRENVRVWFFPATFEWEGNTEDDMITHLNWCYELLKEQKYPGGLMCYTWGYYGGRASMPMLVDPNGEFKYERLAKRFTEIAKEIKNNPYRYNQVVPLN